jgi:hypothetical protein
VPFDNYGSPKKGIKFCKQKICAKKVDEIDPSITVKQTLGIKIVTFGVALKVDIC